MSFAHLVKFPNRDSYKQAIGTFIEQGVSDERVPMPDNQMVVTKNHLAALDRAQVPFNLLSDTSSE